MAENSSNEKATTVRKERRVDYSRDEIAHILSLSPTGVDKKIKELIKEYGLPEGCFKREGESKGRNFFPPEYTPLLMLVMKNDIENPLTGLDSKKKKATADDIRDYNERMIEDMQDGKPTELDPELKEFIEKMPWYRVSEDVVEWTGLLVEEFQELIYNLLTLSGNDLGQNMRYICRELDTMNFCLFRGQSLTKMFLEQANSWNDEFYAGLQQESDTHERSENTQYFSNAYKESNGKLQKVAVADKSIDSGIVSIMKAMMDGMRLGYIQNTKVDKLPQYYSDEERAKKESELEGVSEDEKKRTIDEEERRDYLRDRLPGLLGYMDSFCREPGKISIVNNNGVKWKSIPEKIKDGTFEEDYLEEYIKTGVYAKTGASYEEWVKVIAKPTPDQFKRICEDYLTHYNAVKDNEELREIVNHFIGQVIATYYNQGTV